MRNRTSTITRERPVHTVCSQLWLFLTLRLFIILGVCPDSWIHMQGSCYKLSSGTLNWSAAKSACEALGSKLVSINSQAEQQALASKITYNQRTWIGFYRNPKDKSKWLWLDGSRSTYTNWNAGEPNSLGEECAEIYPKARGWKWNDQSCTDSFRYICEIKGRSKTLCCYIYDIYDIFSKAT